MRSLGRRLDRRLQFLRGRICETRGAIIGDRFGLGWHVVIENPRFLLVEDSVTILGPGWIHCRSGLVRIGSSTSIDQNLWLHCGVEGYCHIGANSYIGCNCVLGAGGGITIGNDVLVGQGVHFHSENHVFASRDLPIRQQGVAYAPILIEDDVWIGARSVILAGLTIGRGAVIGAGAVVTKSIPPYAVAVGVPARIIGARGDS